jgi:hypothetical protein
MSQSNPSNGRLLLLCLEKCFECWIDQKVSDYFPDFLVFLVDRLHSDADHDVETAIHILSLLAWRFVHVGEFLLNRSFFELLQQLQITREICVLIAILCSFRTELVNEILSFLQTVFSLDDPECLEIGVLAADVLMSTNPSDYSQILANIREFFPHILAIEDGSIHKRLCRLFLNIDDLSIDFKPHILKRMYENPKLIKASADLLIKQAPNWRNGDDDQLCQFLVQQASSGPYRVQYSCVLALSEYWDQCYGMTLEVCELLLRFLDNPTSSLLQCLLQVALTELPQVKRMINASRETLEHLVDHEQQNIAKLSAHFIRFLYED